MRFIFLTLIVLFNVTEASLHAESSKLKYEVVVYGATAAGITAAIAVHRDGGKVIIIEPSKHIAGMMTGGLSAADVCKQATLGGISREVFEKIGARYGKEFGSTFEPRVAAEVFNNLIKENNLEILTETALKDIQIKSGKIQSITLSSGRNISGNVFIDASYEGDLMAFSKVSYTIGREGREVYNESMAGVRPDGGMKRHQFQAFINPKDLNNKLLPGVSSEMLAGEGQGDRKVPSYNYRPCLTKRVDLKIPFAAPKGYDSYDYEVLVRYFKAKPDLSHRDLFTVLKVPNGKFDLNNGGPFSTNLIGENWDYPDADFEKRAELARLHSDHIKGLMYFLSTDPKIPARIRNEISSWGYCKDEFTESGNFPSQLYVREARRMIGEYVLTQNDLKKQRRKSDSIAMASCPIESHHVQRLVGKNGAVFVEGHLQTSVSPYQIPYRSILPKRDQVQNLLVPVALSASHVAYSSLRMEPVYMALGQSAGVAAMMASKSGLAVQDIDTTKIRERLLELKQKLGDLPIVSQRKMK